MIIATNTGLNKWQTLEEANACGKVFVEHDDNAVIARLRKLAAAYDPSSGGGERPDVYLILEDSATLWQLQTRGLPHDLYSRLDVVATTVEDLVAKAIFVRLPGFPEVFPPLDRHPITRDSEATVHLVLVGAGRWCEALALNTALVAHYPNYCRDTRLRTRITVIDENIHAFRDALLQRYVHLFDNSWYRMIDLNDMAPQCYVHRPMYDGRRQDFVDVEWEFVNGRLSNSAVRQQLEQWSASPRQQLTIAICHDDEKRCCADALSLPDAVLENSVPVLCHSEHSDLLELVNDTAGDRTIRPYGRSCANLALLKKLKQMARCVNAVYHHCFSLPQGIPVTAPASIDLPTADRLWRDIDASPKVYSNIFSAMTMGTKMHSIGHVPDEWSSYCALSRDEIELLTQVEHNRWSVEELILGYRPVTDEEQQLVEADISQKKVLRESKIHYDLRSYDDLRQDVTGKNTKVYDLAMTQSIPLIIKTCITD